MKQVLVLINPKSGVSGPYRYIAAIEKVWDTPEHDVVFRDGRFEGDPVLDGPDQDVPEPAVTGRLVSAKAIERGLLDQYHDPRRSA